LEPEFRALGVPFKDRGPRTDDYLSAMLAIWSEANPSYHGRFVSFENVQAHPQPVQKPYPPIVIGGRSPAAYRRAVERGNGWYGWSLDLDETAQCLAGIREAASRYSRPAALAELEISVAPSVPVDMDTAQRFAEMGVHRIVLIPRQGSNVDALEGFIDTVGNTLVGRV
jgi:alkanesulfonate monooxygenase SsuD/methylene tetrahydromethanopterin reductase-like flavin-dependent oxidoreductase (luciferase family)